MVNQGDFTGPDYSTACLVSMRAWNTLQPVRPIPSVPKAITDREVDLMVKMIAMVTGKKRLVIANRLRGRLGR